MSIGNGSLCYTTRIDKKAITNENTRFLAMLGTVALHSMEKQGSPLCRKVIHGKKYLREQTAYLKTTKKTKRLK